MAQLNGPEQLSPPALVMQMITGHWVSQLVGSLCRFGIPDVLAEQPLTSAVIARKCGSHPDATYRILRAATGLGLFKEIRPDTSLMDLNMMVMLPGRERALKEYKVLLDASGLKFERMLPTHSPFQIIEASKK